MSRAFRPFIAAAALAIALAACGETKDTGFNNLPKGKAGKGGGDDGTIIAMKAGNTFAPVTFKAKAGDKVTWRNDDTSGQPHNVVADDGAFDSNPQCTATDAGKCLAVKDTFGFAFTKAGTFGYYCVVHGGKGGVGMAGTVEVA